MGPSTNPYRPPLPDERPVHASSDASSGAASVCSRWERGLWWFVFLHPLIVVFLIYSCWGVTVMSLNRAPNFGEHPKSPGAHAAVHGIAFAAALLTLAGVVLVPIGVMWSTAAPFSRRSASTRILDRVTCFVCYVGLLAAALALSVWDPYGAFYWFWD